MEHQRARLTSPACLGFSSYDPIMHLFLASLQHILQNIADLNRGSRCRGSFVADPLTCP